MSLAITDEHRAIARTVAEFLTDRKALADNRALLEAEAETRPTWWPDIAALGWLGLHLPEAHGGAGFGMEELAVVVEQFGVACAPGPFVPTVVVSALLSRTGDPDGLLPGLVDGSVVGGFGLGGPVLGAGLAEVYVVPSGDDVLVVRAGQGVAVEVPPNLDPARRSGHVRIDGAATTVLPGARRLLVDIARVVLAAEAVGVARACTDMAATYARQRQQFGRPIGMFQAVKHHCADMAVSAELATSSVWDAARAAATDGEPRSFAAAVAAARAATAAELCASLNTQVHGGIAITWEHDAHLYVRRAGALNAFLAADGAAAELTELTRRGVSRAASIELPPAAEAIRAEVRSFAERIKPLDEAAQLDAFIETGYVAPHWPRPFGRAAGAVEQLVVEQVLTAAGLARPNYYITGWVILTLIQHGTPEQIERWVRPALHRDTVWCQLFSEPEAGSDAAGVRSRAVRTDGGWMVNGQKVWTTHAHRAQYGLATVRTNPDAQKHRGITTMVIDMAAPGVTVRPLRQTNGQSDFNEVFFDDVFVPDSDVVGAVDAGWTVARATLGNESVSIGSDQDTLSLPPAAVLAAFDANPERLTGGAVRVGNYVALAHAMRLLNLRSAYRAVAGGEPGPEGAIAKLVLSELGLDAADIFTRLAGPDAVFFDGAGLVSGHLLLMKRAMAIAGGTSEIKRNQIGERILGLPRDPLIS